MNIPGYTAEKSVYKSIGRYRAMTGAANALVDGRGVLPQLPPELLLCLRDCQSDPDFKTCRDECFWGQFLGGGGAGGGGGGPKQPPELVCGACKNGRQRCGIPGLGFSYVRCLSDA
jgi:hypothetical protein